MSIQFESLTEATRTSSDANISHTTAGVNRLLIACTLLSSNATTGITSMTYAGDAMTKFSTNDAGPSTNTTQRFMEVWYHIAPALGSNDLNFTQDTNSAAYLAIHNYTGVNQTSPVSTDTTSSNLTSNIQTNVTSAVDELVFDFISVFESGTSLAPEAGQTQRAFDDGALANTTPATSEKQGDASVTMGWTTTGPENLTQIAFALKPAAAGIQRAVTYFHDVNDPAGRIYDDKGRIIQPWELKANNWIRVSGIFSPTSVRYASFTQDPELAFIEEVSYNTRSGLRIKTNRGELTDVLLARAAGGKTL